MDTRNLGYLVGGILVAIVVLTVLGVPPVAWMGVALIAGAAGLVFTFVARRAQADGSEDAGRMAAISGSRSRTERTAAAPDTESGAGKDRLVDVELVRAEDEATGTPAVWLHRRGGRRVHRFASAEGWTVQQVSTKDPDNPKKRVIGETLTFASEADASQAADDLACGVAPGSSAAATPVNGAILAV